MYDVQINMWAVLLATASSMVVGGVWYAKSVFGRQWQKLAGLTDKQMGQDAAMGLSIAVVAGFITAYVLAHVTYLSNSFFQNSFMQDALSTGFWMWLGFQATVIIVHNTFEQRRKKLTLMTIANQFVTIMVMAVIIGWLKP